MNPKGGFSLETTKALTDYLTNFISERRTEVLCQAIKNRTRYITVVLEDVYQSQNASAVLRTCECYGVQDVHIIENTNRFTLSPKVVLGASKWLTMSRYNGASCNTLKAINNLKAGGYRIIATSPYAKHDLDSFNLNDGKFALLFGTELSGLSDVALRNADETLRVPMVGLTESLNLSVTAAICIHTLLSRLRKSEINISLSDIEQSQLYLEWIRLSIKDCKSIEKRFFKEFSSQK